MEIINYIKPRQSGKSTHIVNQSDRNDLIIVNNINALDHIKDLFNKIGKKVPLIITQNQKNKLIVRRINNVWIDDYDFMETKKINEIVKYLITHSNQIITLSTAKYLRDYYDFNLVKNLINNIIHFDYLDLLSEINTESLYFHKNSELIIEQSNKFDEHGMFLNHEEIKLSNGNFFKNKNRKLVC